MPSLGCRSQHPGSLCLQQTSSFSLDGQATIETTDGQVELTGEEAKEMLSKMKKKSNKNFVFVSSDGKTKEITVDVDIEDNDGEKTIIIKKNIDGKEIIEEYKDLIKEIL